MNRKYEILLFISNKSGVMSINSICIQMLLSTLSIISLPNNNLREQGSFKSTIVHLNKRKVKEKYPLHSALLCKPYGC